MYIIGVFGAPFEELQEKGGVEPQLQVFFGVGVAGAGHVSHHTIMELLEFLEWSSAKYNLKPASGPDMKKSYRSGIHGGNGPDGTR